MEPRRVIQDDDGENCFEEMVKKNRQLVFMTFFTLNSIFCRIHPVDLSENSVFKCPYSLENLLAYYCVPYTVQEGRYYCGVTELDL